MNIAIIGCGYVGTAVATHWYNGGHFITATTTSKEKVPELEQVAQQVVVMRGDDLTALQAVLKNQDVVLFSIAPVADQQVDANVYKETYLYTAENLVSVLQNIPTVKQIIYTSSYAIYGNTNGDWVDEKSPVVPVNERGKVLHDTEQVLLAANSENLKVTILRLGGIYGPGRDLIERFGQFAGTTRPGDGEYFTNWIHTEDIVLAIDFALNNQLQGIYNLVDDVPWITRQLLAQVCDRYNLPNVSWDTSQPNLRSYSVRVSNQKIKAAGYKFIHPQIFSKT